MISFNLKQGCNPLCRACSHRGYSMEQSLAQKMGFAQNTLSAWVDSIKPIISVDEEKRWGYRTSVTLAAQWDGQKWLFGTKSLDEVIPIHRCPIHHPLVNRTIEVLSSSLPTFSSFPLAFLSMSKAQCTLVVKQKGSGSLSWFTEELKEALHSIGIEGFWVHYNLSAGRRLFEKGGWVLLFGSKFSVDDFGLTYGPTVFQQQIQELYLESLSRAEVFLDPEPTNSLIDLYSGTGTSLKRWRDRGIAAIGVETSGEALECATVNAPRSTLLRGSCRLRIPQLTQWLLQQVFLSKRILLYANPPRAGIEPETLEWIVRVAKPDRIAYLSCSPGTLSKNLKFLSQRGYYIIEIQPYDFFPNTHHIECLALLERLNIT